MEHFQGMHEKTITKTPSSLRCVCPIADDANILRGFCFETGFKTSVRVTSTPSSRQVACEAGAKRRRGGGEGAEGEKQRNHITFNKNRAPSKKQTRNKRTR